MVRGLRLTCAVEGAFQLPWHSHVYSRRWVRGYVLRRVRKWQLLVLREGIVERVLLLMSYAGGS